MTSRSPARPPAAPGGAAGRTGARAPAEVEQALREVERRHDLLRHTIDGWCAWPLLRFAVGVELQNLPIAGGRPARVHPLRRLAEAALGAVAFLRVPRARYLAKTYTSGLAERADGKYKDVWFDDVLLALGRHVKLEAVNNPDFAERRGEALLPARLTTTPADVAAAALARALPASSAGRVARELADVLTQELGSRAYDAPTVERHLRHFSWSRRFYRQLLRRVRPTHVLTADPGEHALVAAAKELGITVVELQHGFLDRVSHPAYAWTEYATPYKHRMPIPDMLFLYGEHWRGELLANGFWGEAARAVGSPRVDAYRRRRAERRADGTFTVVFSTQGLDVQRTTEFLREFLGRGADRHDLRLVVKLHPVYDRDPAAYRAAFRSDPRVRVLGAAEGETMFELLTGADLHVSISSTCHYEALGLGVPTAVLPFTTAEIMAPLCRAGHATLVATSAALWDLVDRTRAGGAAAPPGEYYFKSGAVENIVRELGERGTSAAEPSTTRDLRNARLPVRA